LRDPKWSQALTVNRISPTLLSRGYSDMAGKGKWLHFTALSTNP